MGKLTLGSLFDGSGGFPLGGLLCGIKPLWASEIEPFPIRVTTKRIPQMKHYGDISKLNGADLPPVDIITFGSPCTDMSVAGKRAGLDGEQSVLFYEAIRIIKEMRCKTNGRYPRYAVWENVPGAFSSNKGADFRAVLEAVIGVKEPSTPVPLPEKGLWSYADVLLGDGWSVAYRTIDAQYFGVPQRRRRIYLVADFAGGSAGEILFESQGVSRDFTPSGSPWKGTAGNAETGPGTSSGGLICLNDQGGSVMSVTEDITATLRAEEHGHQPCVMQSSGFCTEHSAKSRSVGYEEERSPTLRAGVVPGAVMSFEPGAASRVGGHTDENISGSLRANMGDNQTAVAIENHPTDGRCRIEQDGKVQTLTSRMGTGGMNTPLVLDTPKTLKIRSGCEGGGKGALIQEDKSATLGCNNDQTVFVPTAYGICSDKSNSMLSDNPHSGIYEAETSRTIDANGGNPGCNQGGIAVVSLQGSMIGREEKNGPQGSGIDEDVSFTLNTVDRHAIAYAMTTGSFAQVTEEKSPTLMSRDYKDPPLVNQPDYIVRRLTPTECARLQGFPDSWCSDLGTESPTEDEVMFWTEVWETHRKIMGTSEKSKSRRQIIKWLQNPHSNAAEYKMWGNGVCVNCVLMDKVKAAFESARQNPAEENSFRQLRLNQWVKQAIRWMPMDKWDACAFPVDEKSLEGRVCYGGLDLSSSTDITAFVLVFPPADEDDKYCVLPYFWIPEDNIDLRVRRDHVNYDLWNKQGFLQTTEGNVVHYGYIEQFIETLGEKYNIRKIAFDRWGAVQMTQNLETLGFSVVPFGQGFKDMSPPTKELMKLTLEEKIAHGGHPVLRWMMDNIFIRTDPAGNIKADKEKSTEKIDGAVATIMALDRAIRCGNDTGESVYNTRGLLVF